MWNKWRYVSLWTKLQVVACVVLAFESFKNDAGAWKFLIRKILEYYCSARDWDGKDYLRIIPRVVW
jgi:hypothetical protein